MKTEMFKTGLFILLATVWLVGCSSTPPVPERPDAEKIKQGSDRGMKDLEKEEDRRGGMGY